MDTSRSSHTHLTPQPQDEHCLGVSDRIGLDGRVEAEGWLEAMGCPVVDQGKLPVGRDLGGSEGGAMKARDR